MNALPYSEQELKDYLLDIASGKTNNLPDWAELEPGSFLYVVKSLWEKARDQNKQNSKRFFLNDFQIAKMIGDAIQRRFTRTNYHLMFGDQTNRTKAGTSIPKDICAHFLLIAFQNWSACDAFANNDDHANGYSPIFWENEVNLEHLVSKLCSLIYQLETPVRCITSPGVGPYGFYEKCRQENKSIIIATEKKPVIFDDEGVVLSEWIKVVSSLFNKDNIDNSPLHIWALQEPFITDDPRSVSILQNIAELKRACFVGRILCNCGQFDISWNDFSKNCVVALLKNEENDTYREKKTSSSGISNPIIGDFLFPCTMPPEWKDPTDRYTRISDLNFISTVQDTSNKPLTVEYNVFPQKEEIDRCPPVISKPSPSQTSDESFKNLYLASRHYAHNNSHNEKSKEIFDAACQNGWVFMTLDEFLSLTLPA